jgi:hypothetical protein
MDTRSLTPCRLTVRNPTWRSRSTFRRTSITRTQNCLNRKRLLVNRQYLGFVGDFMFVDTQPPPGTNGEDPQWEGLGTRFQLVYIEAADLDAALAVAA